MKFDPKTKSKDHLWIKDICEGARIADLYLVKGKTGGTTKKGEPFISLLIADITGEVEAKIWDRADELSSLFREGDIIGISGSASSYRGRRQVIISDIMIPEEGIDEKIFIESSPFDRSEMAVSLKEILKGVKNSHLLRLVKAFLGDHEFLSIFKRAPAAKNFHHNYIGGLLEHTLSVCRLADSVADQYETLDKDLLLTAAFLHDIGKIREFAFERNIEYTDEGRLIGHLVIGSAMVDEKLADLKTFPQGLATNLKHLILSHHGEYEFGSPKRPKFLEAFALHLIDDLDAKINGLGRFMERDQQEGIWTDFNRLFGRYFLKGELPGPKEGPVTKNEQEERQASLF